MIVTLKQLKAKGACVAQVRKFEELFGASVEVTEALCQKHAEDFDFAWATRLLPAPAQKAFDEAMALAWKAYDEAMAPAQKAFDEATAPAWKAYDEARALAFYHASQR